VSWIARINAGVNKICTVLKEVIKLTIGTLVYWKYRHQKVKNAAY